MSETFRQTVPESLGAVPFNIPKPKTETLSNRLKIVYLEDKRHPIVSLRLAFRSGDINDPRSRIGLNSAMASMLNEGISEYNSREFAEEIERLGAQLSVGAGLDNTIVKASALAAYLPEILNLLAGLVLTPTFPEEELELYKQNTIEGLKFQRSQPDFLADEQVARIIYGDHPYSINSPSPDDIGKLTRDDLIKCHSAAFLPNNSTLIVVGDFDTDQVHKEIERHFGKWKTGEVESPALGDIPIRRKRTLTVVDRPGSTQANIVLSNISIERNHPDYFPVLVMNQILGAGASSRLFMNLREEKGYTYGAYSRFYSKRLAGSFEASSEVRTAVTNDALKEFFLELNRIRDELADERELVDAQNYLAGVFPIRAETQAGLTGLIVSQLLYDLPDDYLDTYRDNVRAVTLEEVRRVANQYIHPEILSIVIVGDADEVVLQASEFAEEIEVFDTDGHPKDVNKMPDGDGGEPEDFSGTWKLTVDSQGQEIPVTLTLTQDGDRVSGNLDSMLGEGTIRDGRVRGKILSAVAITEFQGQEMELGIKGSVEAEKFVGTISTAMIPAPLEFSGSRS